MRHRIGRLLPWALIACLWVAAHGLSLTRYPPMHADEAWLASETRSILAARSAAAGADFFHLTPRSPHAIRLLFHGMQLPFVAAHWSLGSVRLLSLACGAGTVLLFVMIAFRLYGSTAARLLLIGGLAFDPQLFAASHLARPEIVLVLLMTSALAIRARRPFGGYLPELLVGTVLGLSVGVHANSLVIALAVGALYTGDLIGGPDRCVAVRRLLTVVGVTAAWALLWVAWSRILSPDFPRAYAEFGRRYGTGESLTVKLLRLPGFYARLFDRVEGTYHVPDIRVTLILFGVSAVLGTAVMGARIGSGDEASRRLIGGPLMMLAAANIGLAVIGKYSQPSAVLLLPCGYLLASGLLERLADRLRREPTCSRTAVRAAILAATLVVCWSAVSTAHRSVPWMSVSYRSYIDRIRSAVPAGTRVLAGPNTAFAFAPGELHAFNDLDILGESGVSFREYIERYGIEYILYPDELDLIYAERPFWNDLYGNPFPYHADMNRFLDEYCEIVAVFEEPVFAMRPVIYQKRSEARLTVYRVTGVSP